jgi:hypothetical protein
LAAAGFPGVHFSANAFGQAAMAGNSAPEPVPLRIVVRFRPGPDQSFARTCSADVAPAGGSGLTVGLNETFRTAPARLCTWNRDVGSTPANYVLTADNLNPEFCYADIKMKNQIHRSL